MHSTAQPERFGFSKGGVVKSVTVGEECHGRRQTNMGDALFLNVITYFFFANEAKRNERTSASEWVSEWVSDNLCDNVKW